MRSNMLFVAIFLVSCQPHFPPLPNSKGLIVGGPKIENTVEFQCDVADPEFFKPLKKKPVNSEELCEQVIDILHTSNEKWFRAPTNEVVLLDEDNGTYFWYVFKLHDGKWSWCTTLVSQISH